MQKFKKIAFAALAMFSLLTVPAVAFADTKSSLCQGASCNSGAGPELLPTINNITNILLYLAGTIAVIMIIIGGIRYATSGGDQAQVTSAKNTVLYAVIGLIVTVLSYAIVNFVLKRL